MNGVARNPNRRAGDVIMNYFIKVILLLLAVAVALTSAPVGAQQSIQMPVWVVPARSTRPYQLHMIVIDENGNSAGYRAQIPANFGQPMQVSANGQPLMVLTSTDHQQRNARLSVAAYLPGSGVRIAEPFVASSFRGNGVRSWVIHVYLPDKPPGRQGFIPFQPGALCPIPEYLCGDDLTDQDDDGCLICGIDNSEDCPYVTTLDVTDDDCGAAY
jgi:hypothetical protein